MTCHDMPWLVWLPWPQAISIGWRSFSKRHSQKSWLWEFKNYIQICCPSSYRTCSRQGIGGISRHFRQCGATESMHFLRRKETQRKPIGSLLRRGMLWKVSCNCRCFNSMSCIIVFVGMSHFILVTFLVCAEDTFSVLLWEGTQWRLAEKYVQFACPEKNLCVYRWWPFKTSPRIFRRRVGLERCAWSRTAGLLQIFGDLRAVWHLSVFHLSQSPTKLRNPRNP